VLHGQRDGSLRPYSRLSSPAHMNYTVLYPRRYQLYACDCFTNINRHIPVLVTIQQTVMRYPSIRQQAVVVRSLLFACGLRPWSLFLFFVFVMRYPELTPPNTRNCRKENYFRITATQISTTEILGHTQ
jgi:hypothetical protein